MDQIRRWNATTRLSGGNIDSSTYVLHMWCNATVCSGDSSRPRYVVAVWSRSSSSGGNVVYAPAPPGCYRKVDIYGDQLGEVCVYSSGQAEVPVSAAPVYFYN